MENKRYLVVLTILLLVIIGVAVTSCDGTSALVGKWQSTGSEEAYMEFCSDGQLEMGSESLVLSCTYEETGDKEITITLVGFNGEDVDEEEQAVLEYSISGDELTLDDGEEPVTFTRVE